ncbi:MAG: PfkB family carbohydrate kinase [Dermatophilaceae bacterium]
MAATVGNEATTRGAGCCPVADAALRSPEPLIDNPAALGRGFVVTVLGDVRIDVVSALRSRRFTQLTQDHHEPARVATVVGGTAMSFARAAAAHFAEVRVIAAIGEDHWNATIWAAASELGVRACFEEKPGVANGTVLILRDAPTLENPGGVRLLLAQEPSPYDHLDVGLVRRRQDLIATSDALVVDGYALLHERSAAAVDLATQIAVDAGIPVSFDLVPHKIDERLPAWQIDPFLRRASLSIAEAPTLARLLGLPPPEAPSLAFAASLAERLPAPSQGPGQTKFIRFGYGMMEETVAVAAGHPSVHYHTGYSRQADSSGYGYRVAAAELKWWLADATADLALP